VKPIATETLFQTIDKVLMRPIDLMDSDASRSCKLPAAQSPFGDGADNTAKNSPWVILSKTKPFKREADIKQKLEQFKTEHATRDGIEEVKMKNRRQCPVNELLEGQILYQNIEAEEGVILLRQGTTLTKGMIVRLKELAAETEPNQTVFIGELEAANHRGL
jgi:hypothetical protein